MPTQMAFADKILQFNDMLSHTSLDLPPGFRAINPFAGKQEKQVGRLATVFYRKYYDDTCTRRLILGSSPARRGTAVTGIPFEDAGYLQEETGILLDGASSMKSSTSFIYDVMNKYGGRRRFYSDFCMSFVCPIGLVKTNLKGNEVNCNYYENKELEQSLHSFIVSSLHLQLGLGVDASVCYCIGSGENFRYLSKVNDEYHLFDAIQPLEHPRFIMQYNSERKDAFIAKYVNALSRAHT